MSRGFGYVVFGDTDAADAAKVVLNQENGGDRGGNQGSGGNGGYGRAGYSRNWGGIGRHPHRNYGEYEVLYGGGDGDSGDAGFDSAPGNYFGGDGDVFGDVPGNYFGYGGGPRRGNHKFIIRVSSCMQIC